MNSWFANISVNMKLALGFGLVLVFTAILALTGWTSMTGLINRSNWMSDITSLNSQLTKLRVTRLQYIWSLTATRKSQRPFRCRWTASKTISKSC
ncbi:putative membrane protein [Pseudomonas syringae group genomosp. 3]|nr:putative membrane protein [Pseudomonas syringae group genomosp. 3]